MSTQSKGRTKCLSLKKNYSNKPDGKPYPQCLDDSLANLQLDNDDIEIIEPKISLVVIDDSFEEKTNDHCDTPLLKTCCGLSLSTSDNDHSSSNSDNDLKSLSECAINDSDVFRPDITVSVRKRQSQRRLYSDNYYSFSSRDSSTESNKESFLTRLSNGRKSITHSICDEAKSRSRRNSTSCDISSNEQKNSSASDNSTTDSNNSSRTRLRKKNHENSSQKNSLTSLDEIILDNGKSCRSNNLNKGSNRKSSGFQEKQSTENSTNSFLSPNDAMTMKKTPTSVSKITTPTFCTKSNERKSSEKCTINKIRQSHQVILNELYGDVWKSIPTLFKKRINVENNYTLDGVAKKLDFDDEDDSSDGKSYRKSLDKFISDVTDKSDEDFDLNEKTSELVGPLVGKPTNKRVKELSGRRDLIKSVGKKTEDLNVKKLSFVASLADNIPTWRCDPEALLYKNKFKTKRDELTSRLYEHFNRVIFQNKLSTDMTISWDAKLRSTAGTTTNRLLKHSQMRVSSIKLSSKVVDTAQRLRDTLVHEMCHSATWVIDKELKAGHGALWKKWATRALKAVPELVEISRCHTLDIYYKYSYKCTQCGYSINRHSKSLDTERKACGYCRGRFELIVNKKNKDGVVIPTPAKNVGGNVFAAFVKENYGSAKKPGFTHAQVMKSLSAQYSAIKSKK